MTGASPVRDADTATGTGHPDLGELFRVLWRHAHILLAAALACAVLAVAVGRLLPPRYDAQGILRIDTQEVTIPELQTVRESESRNPWQARSEATVLTSRELVESAVRALDLAADPAFNPDLRPSLTERLQEHWPLVRRVRDLLRSSAASGLPPPAPETVTAEAIRQDLVAGSEERSFTIWLRYLGRAPDSAAALVNALMDSYVAQDVRAKREATAMAGAQLKARMEALAGELEEARAAIRELEARGDLVQTGQGTITAQEAAALAEERLGRERELAKVEADLAQVQGGLAAGGLNLLNSRLVTPRLKALWEAEAKLQGTMAQDAVDYGQRHPRMIALQNEVARIHGEIGGEVLAIRGSLEQQAKTLRTQTAALGERLNEMQRAAGATAGDRLHLAQLQEKIAGKQSLHDRYRAVYEQTLANDAVFQASARVVSRAMPATRPAGPSASLRAVIGAMIGGLLAAAFVVARTWLSDRVTSLDDAARLANTAPLGSVPEVGGWLGRSSPAEVAETGTRSPAFETIRGILYRMRLDEGHALGRVIMVSSPGKGDGKSSLVAALARTGAHDGLRCVAIDCDFHRASLAGLVRQRPLRWLDEYGQDHTSLDELIVRDASGADFILARPIQDCSRAFIEGLRLHLLTMSLRSRYDLIVVDTPPLLSVVDPQLLSRFADAMILVLPWGAISRRLAREAVERLRWFACPLAGVVLSRARGGEQRGYAYAGYPGAKGKPWR